MLFPKWWKSTGFRSLFARRMIFCRKKDPGNNALHICIWKNKFHVSALWGGPKCMFSFIYYFGKSFQHIGFYFLKCTTGCLILGVVFKYFSWQIKKSTQYIEKSIGVISIFSLGTERFSHFGRFPENVFYYIYLLQISAKHRYLRSQMRVRGRG